MNDNCKLICKYKDICKISKENVSLCKIDKETRESEKLIFGYTFEQIKRKQQGK